MKRSLKYILMKIYPEKMTIERIWVTKSQVSTSEEFLDNPQRPDQIEVQHKQDTGYDIKGKKARIQLETFLEGTDENKNKLGVSGHFIIVFFIYIENLEDFIIEDENKKTVHGFLGNTLISIIFSTARGIILERTHGTFLSGVILPVINPNDLIIKSSHP